MQNKLTISSLLSHGDIGTIAARIGLSTGATSSAIKRGNPGHPAVREALRIAKESGALEAAKALASIAA